MTLLRMVSSTTLSVARRAAGKKTIRASTLPITATQSTAVVGAALDRLLFSTTTTTSSRKDNDKEIALVLGSSGTLGSTISKYLSRELGMKVIGADVIELQNDTDWELDDFIPVPHYIEKPTIADVTHSLASGIHLVLGDTQRISTIVCASGGWEGDPKLPPGDGTIATEKDVTEGALIYGDAIGKMMCMNLYPVVAAGYTAQHFMKENGLFVVIGATAALSATPGMLGYGLAKTSAHHFVQTVGVATGNNTLEHKSIRKQVKSTRAKHQNQNFDTLTIVGILPTTIDTPSNRKSMPDANFDSWTKPREIAEEIGTWIHTPSIRPHSGALVKVFSTKHTGTTFDIVR